MSHVQVDCQQTEISYERTACIDNGTRPSLHGCFCCFDDRHYVLATTNKTSISDVGQVRWHLTLCLTLSWIIVFLCILKGVKSSGKV